MIGWKVLGWASIAACGPLVFLCLVGNAVDEATQRLRVFERAEQAAATRRREAEEDEGPVTVGPAR
ncbi:MAG: hypothetical protein IIB61_03785 [Planctomycetes bacterium]|nr:hypothetical protein [Planctomycetota bacterium]